MHCLHDGQSYPPGLADVTRILTNFCRAPHHDLGVDKAAADGRNLRRTSREEAMDSGLEGVIRGADSGPSMDSLLRLA
jgi:hypothetical protein